MFPTSNLIKNFVINNSKPKTNNITQEAHMGAPAVNF